MGYLNDVAKYAPVVKTVGPGEVGPKSRSLRADMSAIQDVGKNSGLFFPSHISVTPKLLQRFFMDSGALSAKSAKEAQKRLIKGKFTPAEIDEIKTALLGIYAPYKFTDFGTNAFMVRSDDYPAGVGLWHSGAASVMDRNIDHLVEQVLHQIRLILASDFRDDVAVFKAMKGITENPGAMIMPAFGARMRLPYQDYVLPLYSMNYLVIQGVGSTVSLGHGIGGANAEYAYGGASAGEAFSSFIDLVKMFDGTLIRKRDGVLVKMNIRSIMDSCSNFLSGEDALVQELSPDRSIGALVHRLGSRYVELVNDDEDGIRNLWVVVQSAPVSYGPVTRPAADKSSIVTNAFGAVGTKVVSSGKLRYSPNHKPTAEDIAFNEGNEGYVLVIDASYANVFREWSLKYLSNASAVILNVGDLSSSLASHLNGYLRALGIPVLTLELPGDLHKSLIREPIQNRNCLVYANEFANRPQGGFRSSPTANSTSEGFLAIEK
ncbi:MAG: hypothetical protein WCT31_00515 [Candidatus Micrarchaeia archaeon]